MPDELPPSPLARHRDVRRLGWCGDAKPVSSALLRVADPVSGLDVVRVGGCCRRARVAVLAPKVSRVYLVQHEAEGMEMIARLVVPDRPPCTVAYAARQAHRTNGSAQPATSRPVGLARVGLRHVTTHRQKKAPTLITSGPSVTFIVSYQL